MFARMSGVEEITSTSRNGSGNIHIRFDKHKDMEAARFEVSTLIRQVWTDLPEGAYYPEISLERPDDGAQRAFLVFSVNALDEPLTIQQNAERVFRSGFTDIDGVSAVNINGADNMEWHLEYDYAQLQQIGASITDIQNAISDYRSKSNIGNYVLTTDVPDSVFETDKIFVKTADSANVPLSRLVTKKYVRERPWSLYRVNGLNSIYLELRASESANQIELQKRVVQRIESLKKQLPKGYEIHKIYDATDYIGDELDKILFNSLKLPLVVISTILVSYAGFS